MRGPTFLPRKLLEITAEYERRLKLGYPVTFGEASETLQVFEDVDKTNWLTVYTICVEAVAAELGDLPVTVFVTGDGEYEITFAQCAWMLGEMRAWGFAMDANWRRLVKLAKAATTNADLNAIDETAGYP